MNVLILMTDQHRFDALSCAGSAAVHTPNLDALAAEGTRFSEACCPTPVCIASRHSFMTGRRARDHRWVANNALPGPRPELPTIMTLLHQQGYHTHGVGKMHFHGRHHGLEVHERMEECCPSRIDDDYLMYLEGQGVRTRYPQGLRDLLYYQPQTCGIPERHSQNAWVARRAIECLRQHQRYRGDQPLFLWASWIAPHPPFAPCEPYDSLYDPDDMPAPIYPGRPLATLPSVTWGHRARLDGAHMDPDRIKRIRALYHGQIAHVDNAIGRVLAALEQLGMAEDTAVLFTSDHGDMLGDHGLSQKNVPYEPSIRVPMILRWPGRTTPGTVCDDLVGLTDVLPTLIDELAVPYPTDLPPLPGASLLGRDGGGLGRKRTGYMIDYGDRRNRWICSRSKTHKYVLWADGGAEELYDLTNDPHELTNIAAEKAGLVPGLRERVLAWERTQGLLQSFDGSAFRTFPAPPLPDGDPKGVNLNESKWPDQLPVEERHTVETFAEAFSRAVAKETALSPDKLSLSDYKRKRGAPLKETPWQEAWEKA
ncbi:MAG: sulfatase-like hydrolase/transferase [Lentisphaerae bacterium]|nr:sulfatase-like hydrolase/transferase [Lentisphaerota bacterium]MBT4819512.1 sulfatase-like hydrolase/transferase [Lentisphaerota bacterium]MBT5610085.1 sulfatase-like hydrolase/transferase [Lentisphaerota bacterium]MBT7059813.1 sulfatase-like hydrolase/transferase [Lentisphaerota bacterium]MBT7847242.1 sulfatase-like hydrolase/transferase [Lentisphaerota bacterium]